MSYPEQINLPFNFSAVSSRLTLLPPAADTPTQEGYWSIIQGGSVIVCQRDDASLALPEGDLPSWLAPRHAPLCIGLWDGRPLRAFTVGSSLTLQEPFVVEPFNAGVDRLDIALLTLSGVSKQILYWQRESRHCSRCGAVTEGLPGTWGKRCTACGSEHFPHIHPCAIVLVRRGDEVLLTRKAEWPAGRYSLVAGFLDFGESLEECAAREIREETGIIAKNIRYVGSQCWPFPSQIMAGFIADYAAGDVVVDTGELEDARWFSVDALPTLPPSRSIARWILDTYAHQP